MTPRKRIIPVFIPHVGCPNDCAFCNQRIIAGIQKAPDPTEVALEVEKQLESAGGKAELAYYGGSFTAIDGSLQEEYLKAVQPYLSDGRLDGIRVSTRPDAISEPILDRLEKYGVKMIELGAQSMNAEVLAANRRGHTPEATFAAAKMIKSRGFKLGLQMMTGLYMDTDQRSIETAKSFITMKPDTVRIYPTVVLRGTYLEELYNKGEYKSQDPEEAAELCAGLYLIFTENNINVIRMGLNTSDNILEEAVAGAYHPAFGEMVFSRIYLKKAINALEKLKYEGKYVNIYVPARDISKMTGQKRSNLIYLKSNYHVKGFKILPLENYVKDSDSEDEVSLCI